MPLYAYDCTECKLQFSIRHSYAAKGILCTACKSTNIKKNLSQALQTTKITYNNMKKVGSHVQEAIQDNKKELNNYKKKQKNREYTKK